jgi:hypothetical protein
MLSGLQRADRVVGVQVVGQGDVDGVDLIAGEQGIIPVIAHHFRHVVEGRKLAGGVGAPRDDGLHPGVPGQGNRRHDGFLRNPARTDDGVTYHGSPHGCAGTRPKAYPSGGQMRGLFAKNDHAEDVIIGDVLDVHCADQLAIFHDRRPITELHDVVDVMLDQEDA